MVNNIKEGKKEPEKKSYYEIQLDALNCIEGIEAKKKYCEKIDFSQKIEKNNDAKIIKDIGAFKDLADEGVLKDNKSKEKGNIKLPGTGKLISVFAKEVANEIKDKNTLFFRHSSREIVEIGKIKCKKDSEEDYTGFMEVKPNRFITLAEEYFIPSIELWNDSKKYYEFKKKSMSNQLTSTLLASKILQEELPQINRIFTIPIPIKYKGKLTFPKRGYDERFNSWLPYNAPEILDENMSLEEAKKLIKTMLEEFCLIDRQAYINAISGLLTPFLRGLFPSFSTRTPVFFYLANRERAGKDYLAGISGIVYEGSAIEDSPISNSENSKSNNTEELRKKILASMINGRKRLHFANNKGYINNAVFEAVTTAETYSDRLLGKNENLRFDNEIDFSLSGNVGVSFTPDFANRSRFIRLHLDVEDANSISFKNPNLHEWVKKNRGLVLSALYSLVRNWIENGEKPGKVNFASFPSWARICGGIMENAGYESPCSPDKETIGVGGDSESEDMKQLFELCYEKYPDQWMQKTKIREILINDYSDLFSYFDFEKRSDQTKFGNKITKFVNRILSDIRLIIKDSNIRSSRQELKFTKNKINYDKSNIFVENQSKLNEKNNIKVDKSIHPYQDSIVDGSLGIVQHHSKPFSNNNIVNGVIPPTKTAKTTKEPDFTDEERSNPVMKFIEDDCEECADGIIQLREFTNLCNEYLKEKHLRILTAIQIGKILRNEGYSVGKRKIGDISAVVILNLKVKTTRTTRTTQISSSSLRKESSSKMGSLGSLGSFQAKNQSKLNGENAKNHSEVTTLYKGTGNPGNLIPQSKPFSNNIILQEGVRVAKDTEVTKEPDFTDEEIIKSGHDPKEIRKLQKEIDETHNTNKKGVNLKNG